MALFVELAGVNAAAVGGDVWGSLVFGCASCIYGCLFFYIVWRCGGGGGSGMVCLVILVFSKN